MTTFSMPENRVEYPQVVGGFIPKTPGLNAGQAVERWCARWLLGDFVDASFDILACGIRYEVKTINSRAATYHANLSVSTPNGWAFETPDESCTHLAERVVGKVFDALVIVHTAEDKSGYTIEQLEILRGEAAVDYIIAAASFQKQGTYGKLRLASNPDSVKAGGQSARHATLAAAGHPIR